MKPPWPNSKPGPKAQKKAEKPPKPLGIVVLNALVAGISFIVGVWAYFYIDRIPVSRRLDPETKHLVAASGTTMVVGGLAPGPLMSVNLRASGRLRLSVDDHGATVVAPSVKDIGDAQDAEPPGGDPARTTLDIFKSGTGNASLDFELKGTGPMSVELIPIAKENGRSGFRITPRGGILSIHALMIDGGDGKPGEMTLMSASRTTQWDEASSAVADGKAADILADDPPDKSARSTVIEFPNYSTADPVISGTLPAASVAVGDSASGDFSQVRCGSGAPGEKRFVPLVFPTVTLTGCKAAALTLSALDPFGEVALDARGTSFVVKDGNTSYWDGLSLLVANPLFGQALKGAVVAPFLLWAGLAFKALWKRLRSK